jgi:hypothetical protein
MNRAILCELQALSQPHQQDNIFLANLSGSSGLANKLTRQDEKLLKIFSTSLYLRCVLLVDNNNSMWS